MNYVSTLSHQESAGLDDEKLAELYVQLGEGEAESVVCRALEEVSARLQSVKSLMQLGDAKGLARASRSLVGISNEIGMTKLGRVAQDVVYCFEACDTAGFGATAARLLRVGEESLMGIGVKSD